MPIVEPTRVITSKDDALRITLEAQRQPPMRDKPLPAVVDRDKAQSHDAPAQKPTGAHQMTAKRSSKALPKPVKPPVVPEQAQQIAEPTPSTPPANQPTQSPELVLKPSLEVVQGRSSAPSNAPAVRERCSAELSRFNCELRECQKPENSTVVYCKELIERYVTDPTSNH